MISSANASRRKTIAAHFCSNRHSISATKRLGGFESRQRSAPGTSIRKRAFARRLGETSFAEDLQHSSSRRCAKISQTCFTPSIQNRQETAGPPQIQQKQPSASPSSPISGVDTSSDSRRRKNPRNNRKRFFSQSTIRVLIAAAPAISVIVTLYNYSDLHSGVPEKPGRLAHCGDSGRHRGA